MSEEDDVQKPKSMDQPTCCLHGVGVFASGSMFISALVKQVAIECRAAGTVQISTKVDLLTKMVGFGALVAGAVGDSVQSPRDPRMIAPVLLMVMGYLSADIKMGRGLYLMSQDDRGPNSTLVASNPILKVIDNQYFGLAPALLFLLPSVWLLVQNGYDNCRLPGEHPWGSTLTLSAFLGLSICMIVDTCIAKPDGVPADIASDVVPWVEVLMFVLLTVANVSALAWKPKQSEPTGDLLRDILDEEDRVNGGDGTKKIFDDNASEKTVNSRVSIQ